MNKSVINYLPRCTYFKSLYYQCVVIWFWLSKHIIVERNTQLDVCSVLYPTSWPDKKKYFVLIQIYGSVMEGRAQWHIINITESHIFHS